MNIIDATKQAMEQGRGMTNSSLKEINCYLLPTNTSECYIVMPNNYKHTEKRKVAARWNPHAADIIAEDWEVTE